MNGWSMLIGGAVVVGLVAAAMFNTLIVRRNRVENAFASIDVMLKKRYDLIPSLVATVKGYAKHESSVLERLAELRSALLEKRISTDDAVKMNNELTQTLRQLLAVVENYPQLKANENFMHLQRTLTEIEEQLSASRRAFNASVLDYNNAVEMFPISMMAAITGFKRRPFFEAHEGEREAPSVAEDR